MVSNDPENRRSTRQLRSVNVTWRPGYQLPPMTNTSISCNINPKIWSVNLRHFGRIIWTLLPALLFAVPGGAAGLRPGSAKNTSAAISRVAHLCNPDLRTPISFQSPRQSLQRNRSDQIASARRRRRRRTMQASSQRTSPVQVQRVRPNGLIGWLPFLGQASNSGRSPPLHNPSLL